MNEEILERLDLLAEKLGVATEHLWRILVKQAYIDSIHAAFWFLISIIILYLSIKRMYKYYKNWDEFVFAKSSFWFIVSLLFIIIFFSIGVQAISKMLYVINPEYFALKQLMNIIK